MGLGQEKEWHARCEQLIHKRQRLTKATKLRMSAVSGLECSKVNKEQQQYSFQYSHRCPRYHIDYCCERDDTGTLERQTRGAVRCREWLTFDGCKKPFELLRQRHACRHCFPLSAQRARNNAKLVCVHAMDSRCTRTHTLWYAAVVEIVTSETNIPRCFRVEASHLHGHVR